MGNGLYEQRTVIGPRTGTEADDDDGQTPDADNSPDHGQALVTRVQAAEYPRV